MGKYGSKDVKDKPEIIEISGWSKDEFKRRLKVFKDIEGKTQKSTLKKEEEPANPSSLQYEYNDVNKKPVLSRVSCYYRCLCYTGKKYKRKQE